MVCNVEWKIQADYGGENRKGGADPWVEMGYGC